MESSLIGRFYPNMRVVVSFAKLDYCSESHCPNGEQGACYHHLKNSSLEYCQRVLRRSESEVRRDRSSMKSCWLVRPASGTKLPGSFSTTNLTEPGPVRNLQFLKPTLRSIVNMNPLVSRTSTMLRLCPRRQVSIIPAKVIAMQRRDVSDATSQFTSDSNPTTKIPSFAKYMSKRGETSNKTFQYFMVGSMGVLAAAGAKATINGRSGYHNLVLRLEQFRIHSRRSSERAIANIWSV